jgi:MFS family permease
MENRQFNWTAVKSMNISKLDFVINALLFSNLFSFYYVFDLAVIPLSNVGISGNLNILQACFIFSIAVSILLTSQVYKKFQKKHIIASTSLSSIGLLFLFISPTFEISLIIVLLIGVTFGVSQLASYVYFWKSTRAAERGRLGGLLGLITLPVYFVNIAFISTSLDHLGNLVLCIVLCLLVIIGASLIKEKEAPKKREELAYYPEKRTIILYSLPWVIFCFLNYTFSKNITIDISQLLSPSFYAFLTICQTFGGLLGAVLGGFLADRGRRLTLVFSFIFYGISTTFKGFLNNDATFFFAYLAEGISGGMLLTLYSFVIWGDLANNKNVSKVYSIGLISYYFFMGMGLLPTFLSGISPLSSALISCLLIFASFVPIILAPELLFSDAQEKIQLKKYMKTVKKIADKTADQE